MTDRAVRNASIVSAALAIILCLTIYLLFATVDVVFMKNDYEVYRLNNVSVISDLTLPEEFEATYVYGEENLEFNDELGFRLEIGKTLLVNLFSFKWEESDNLITVTRQ